MDLFLVVALPVAFPMECKFLDAFFTCSFIYKYISVNIPSPQDSVRDINALAELYPEPLLAAASPVKPVPVAVNAGVERIAAFCTENLIHVWVVFF